MIIAPVRPTSHVEDSEDIQEKFPPRHFPCFRVGRRIALIREHFCVNWLNLEAIWRRGRHMLRTPGHLSKVQATLGEQGEVAMRKSLFPRGHATVAPSADMPATYATMRIVIQRWLHAQSS